MTNKLLYDEMALLAKVREGDEWAFTILFQQWQPILSTYIFRITRSREVAMEVVQDVFLKIWINRETLDSIYNFKSYLFTASRNHAINALKKAFRELRQMQDLQSVNSSQQAGISGAEYISEDPTDLPSLLDEAIDHLSPRQKQVYLLHKHQQLTYREIAVRLGIGKESVKTHLELAIKAITKHLRGRMASVSILAVIFL